MLYPYINTPGGLAQWFADDVIVKQNKHLVFFWDQEKHEVKITSQKLNKYIRFEFMDNGKDDTSTDGAENIPFIEINLDPNELTGTVFMKVVDTATVTEDDDELHEIWQYLTDNLKEIVGG